TDLLEELLVRPATAQANHDAAATHRHGRRHLDQGQAPRRRLTLAQWVLAATSILVSYQARMPKTRERTISRKECSVNSESRGSALRDDLDDATQEVFVECFRQGGAVEVAGAGRVPDFRAFLYGVIRNVARRFESRPVRAAGPFPEIVADDASQSRLFDRTWAQAIRAQAARLQRERAAVGGP